MEFLNKKGVEGTRIKLDSCPRGKRYRVYLYPPQSSVGHGCFPFSAAELCNAAGIAKEAPGVFSIREIPVVECIHHYDDTGAWMFRIEFNTRAEAEAFAQKVEQAAFSLTAGSATRKRIRQVRDALNKTRNPQLIEEIATLLNI